MKKILITGGKGMLGTDLTNFLTSKGFTVVSVDRDELDITDQNAIGSFLDNHTPEVLINCAAYTDVNAAEDEGKDLNYLLNAIAPKYLAEATKKAGVTFFQISTDYVFGENNEQGYLESDVPSDQLNEYGKAKREGEVNVMKSNPNAYICRTSWLYGQYGKNFVDTMITLGKERGELSLVTDEVGVPTWTIDVSRQLQFMIEHQDELTPGYYHVVNEESCSRYEQAAYIFEVAIIAVKLNETTLATFQRKAKVPNISILKNTKLPSLQTWKEAITEYIHDKTNR